MEANICIQYFTNMQNMNGLCFSWSVSASKLDHHIHIFLFCIDIPFASLRFGMLKANTNFQSQYLEAPMRSLKKTNSKMPNIGQPVENCILHFFFIFFWGHYTSFFEVKRIRKNKWLTRRIKTNYYTNDNNSSCNSIHNTSIMLWVTHSSVPLLPLRTSTRIIHVNPGWIGNQGFSGIPLLIN